MRDRFNRRGRKKFLKKMGKDVDGLQERGFTDKEIKTIQSGNVPTDYIVHHKQPLFRGGNNSYNNLNLIKEKFHQDNFKELYYYNGDSSSFY